VRTPTVENVVRERLTFRSRHASDSSWTLKFWLRALYSYALPPVFPCRLPAWVQPTRTARDAQSAWGQPANGPRTEADDLRTSGGKLVAILRRPMTGVGMERIRRTARLRQAIPKRVQALPRNPAGERPAGRRSSAATYGPFDLGARPLFFRSPVDRPLNLRRNGFPAAVFFAVTASCRASPSAKPGSYFGPVLCLPKVRRFCLFHVK